MPNFTGIINLQKKKIINNYIPKPSTSTFNCCSRTSCPLNGDCLQSSFVYIFKADKPNVIGNHPHYIDLTENTCKDRFYKHKNLFKYESKRNATEMSNFAWENKHANTGTNLVWNVLDKFRSYKPEAKKVFVVFNRAISHYFLYVNFNQLKKGTGNQMPS